MFILPILNKISGNVYDSRTETIGLFSIGLLTCVSDSLFRFRLHKRFCFRSHEKFPSYHMESLVQITYFTSNFTEILLHRTKKLLHIADFDAYRITNYASYQTKNSVQIIKIR